MLITLRCALHRRSSRDTRRGCQWALPVGTPHGPRQRELPTGVSDRGLCAGLQAIRAKNSIHVLKTDGIESVPRPIVRFEEAPARSAAQSGIRQSRHRQRRPDGNLPQMTCLQDESRPDWSFAQAIASKTSAGARPESSADDLQQPAISIPRNAPGLSGFAL